MEPLDTPRAEPDFEAADELAEWAVENAAALAKLDAPQT
jgi:hypothetical protein